MILGACAPTTSELFVKANSSGNWTAVNQRLAQEDEGGRENSCREGLVLVCEGQHAASCQCEAASRFDEARIERATINRRTHRY